jgi:hypothetical protein
MALNEQPIMIEGKTYIPLMSFASRDKALTKLGIFTNRGMKGFIKAVKTYRKIDPLYYVYVSTV